MSGIESEILKFCITYPSPQVKTWLFSFLFKKCLYLDVFFNETSQRRTTITQILREINKKT